MKYALEIWWYPDGIEHFMGHHGGQDVHKVRAFTKMKLDRRELREEDVSPSTRSPR